MTRKNKKNPPKEEADEALSPLKKLREKFKKNDENEVQVETVSVKATSSLYQLDWTLGQFSPESEEYKNVLNTLAPEDWGITYPREHFLNILAHSFSLSFQEKKRVLVELSTGITQFQVNELINTFESERAEFEALLITEEKYILSLYLKSLFDWSKILVGMGLSTQVMGKVVEDAICDTGKLVPRIFTRGANFWRDIANFSILCGLDGSVLNAIIAKGINAHEVEENDRLFQLHLIDYVYRTNLYSQSSPRTYIQRRVELLRACIFDSLPEQAPKITVCRTWLLGFAEDYFRLGQRAKTSEAIAAAGAILDGIPDSDRGDAYQKTAALYVTSQLVLEANSKDFDIEKILGYLQKIYAHSKSHITSNAVILALMLTRQGEICCEILANKIENENNPNEILDTATDLLIFAIITANEDTKDTARECLFQNLKSNLQELAKQSHSKDLNLLRRRYIETMIFVWIGGDKDECTEILQLWHIASGDGFHNAMKSDRDTKKRAYWPGVDYWLIRIIEQRIGGIDPDDAVIGSSIKEYWQIQYALILLYALSANVKIRMHCKEISRTLMDSSDRRLFGFPLGEKLQHFQPFTHGKHYAGSSEQQTQQWRGQLSWKNILT